MASADFTKIGSGALGVVADVDNISSPNIMIKNVGADAAERAWYQNDTIGTVGDSFVKVSAKLTDGGSGVPALWLGVRQAGNLDDSDGYQIRVTQTLFSLFRVVSTVSTALILNTPIVLPAGGTVYNDHRLSVATDGGGVRIRFEAAVVAGAFTVLVDFEDTDSARITAAGKVRFGAELIGSELHTVRIDDFDGGTLV